MAEVVSTDLFTVNREICVGSGMCVVYAEGTFDVDDSAKVVVLDPHGDPDETVRAAVEACPSRALKLVKAEGDSK